MEEDISAGSNAGRKLRHVVAAVEWDHTTLGRFRAALGPHTTVTVLDPATPSALSAALRDPTVDGAIVETVATADRHLLLRLQWLHVLHAGAETLATPELLSQVIVTTSAGRSAEALADHALFLLLSVVHQAPLLARQQRRRLWRRPAVAEGSALYGRSALIVGTGATGHAVARRLDAMGLDLYGLRRSGRCDLAPFIHVEHWGEPGRVSEMLAECSVLVLAAPLTNETHHMIGAAELDALGSDGIIVNVGRGALIDEQALVTACREGRIRGAGLDVVEQEPLSPLSGLWSAPGVVITPHA